ncbi:hypothetical protein HanIR_Chr03g0131651 [Helianthus annuus]|nr:hypothetical protein HanIR_Chr03g0131651 [Helianthus annuus]
MNDKVDAKRKEVEVVSEEKVVNVHKETSAVFDLQGRAVVGRAKDFGCLISMKDILSKAGVCGSKLYYLGGLNMMLAFEDDIESTDFILNVNMWKEWFVSLDIWSGQSMAYERLTWIKFHGMPLHLAENKVFEDVASLFGKVVKGSQLSPKDWDLSTNSVVVLVDQGSRIADSVTLKWKNKSFKMWVLEELDD